MAYRSGQHGQLFIKNDNITQLGAEIEIGKVRDWTINLTHSPLDTTTLGDKDRTKMQGLREFNGSGTLLYYEELNSNFTQMMRKTFKTGTLAADGRDFGTEAGEPEMVRFIFALDSPQAAVSEKIMCFGYISAFNITCATGEVVSAQFSFEGHGAPHTIDFK